MAELFSVKDLETQFHTREGTVHAVNGVSFSLQEGETLGIVGESGCGKSVSMLSTLRLIPQPPGEIVSGEAIFQGRDLLKLSREELRHVRGAQIGFVFQDPMTSFNPVQTIGKQIMEPLEIHLGMDKKQAWDRAVEMLNLVRIPNPEDRMKDYPHQFSGGMRQRAMIAMALTCSPQILIADEPTTALDVTIQAQIMDLVLNLREELGMSIIWITHDLGVIAGLADRVVVMYAGYIVEEANVTDLYASPEHPYTLGLLRSLPRLDLDEKKRLVSIEGVPPVLFKRPTFCPFASRCPYRIEKCLDENPQLMLVGENHRVACWVDTKTEKER
ncbi:MAG TPA: peptide ABC transporter ATP-binding protein [Anaerolineaceae bacterium]|nr:peptide ABC transporter ATP-binding protein [Anaerolineaceae bacterium]